MSRNIQPRQVVSYRANCAGAVGGRNGPSGPMEARLRQQEELDRKAAIHAVKLQQKEDEKRQKRIERWEFMNGMGPGQFVGGSEYDAIPFLEQSNRVVVKQEAMEAARKRMQNEHNVQLAQAKYDLKNQPATDQNMDKRAREREEAKRLKKIADWERMNGIACGAGHVLGGGALQGRGNVSKLLGESSQAERQMAFPPTSRTRQENCVSGESSAGRAGNLQATQSSPPQPDVDEQLSEQAKREAMRAARLRMQQNLNQKIEEQKTKEQQNQPPAPFTPSKKLAAKFSALEFS